MSTLDKSIITPSEASGIAQAAFDTVNSLLPFSNVFPMKSNDGQTTVSWTPVIPADATSAVDFRAWDAEVGYGASTSKTAEEYTGLIPLSKKMHITGQSSGQGSRAEVESRIARIPERLEAIWQRSAADNLPASDVADAMARAKIGR